MNNHRLIIESVRPEVDCGRFPVKRALGEEVRVEADVFTDGHDAVLAELLYRRQGEEAWQSKPMEFLLNDHWAASFTVEELGRYEYTVRGWVDPYLTWQRDLEKWKSAGTEQPIDYQIGEEMKKKAREVVPYERVLQVIVDPPNARFSTWYEMFPRSFGGLRGMVNMLPYVAEMGFDVLYLPPVHPIGVTARKGRNNAVSGRPGDVGSPWAIGGREGGHKAIHPELGSFDDFDFLVKEAKKRGMRVALDIAFQASPDHPYVKAHPQWFRWRPDGTVQYAENPPKKYQDIYPFELTERSLWQELKSVFEFWVSHGVTVFRVDNPHTKPFAFWQWCISSLKNQYPELVFLSEAFTRPRIMHRLAKLGFTQSYTYFTWRNHKQELIEYFTELTQQSGREYFRPNVWPNTPDILHETLQTGGRPAFIARIELAATLAANYGIYGPAFELMERVPREPGSEEYLNSEKYEVKKWDTGRADSLRELIGRLNAIRRRHADLQQDWNLQFHDVDNGQLIAYSKGDILTVVNLDFRSTQSGWIDFGFDETFVVEDLLGGGRYTWHGRRNFVMLNPQTLPAHVFHVVRG
ncbi:MAG: alpha-1,4-glucan--maltose-1-phosphate maltosyltransferase [Betaproteobacteria bacterium]